MYSVLMCAGGGGEFADGNGQLVAHGERGNMQISATSR